MTYRQAKGRSLKDERQQRSLDHVRIHAYQSDDSEEPSYLVEHHHDDGSIREHHFDGHEDMIDHVEQATHPDNIKPYEDEAGEHEGEEAGGGLNG